MLTASRKTLISLFISTTLFSGSALSSVLLIAGSAGSIGYMTYAVTRVDQEINTQADNSTLAYRSASAGLELGLLYFSRNHDVELSANCVDVKANCPTTPTQSQNKPIRIYINHLGCPPTPGKACLGGTSGKYWEEIDNQTPAPPANEQVVDLKIYYKQAGQIGDLTNFLTNDQNPTLRQDEPRDIMGIRGLKSIKLYIAGLKTRTDSTVPAEYQGKSWKDAVAQFQSDNGGSLPKADHLTDPFSENQKFFSYFCNKPDVVIKSDPFYNDPHVPCGISIMKTDIWGNIKKAPAGRDPDIYVPLRKATNLVYYDGMVDTTSPWYGHWIQISGNGIDHIRIKPINMDLQYVVDNVETQPANQPVYLDSGISHIEATGHFGGVQRKLEVKIDRNTNIPMGIFDFALFSNSPLIPPSDL